MIKHTGYILALLLSALILANCSSDRDESRSVLSGTLEQAEGITGKNEYRESPYVTAGRRLYMVGHQDCSFPDLGWHVKGEMGGIWVHPVKLMDGFSAGLISGNETLCLAEADSFINYPFGNRLIYSNPYGLKIERAQMAADDIPAMMIEYSFSNPGEEDVEFLFEFNGMSDLRPVWLGERTGMEDSRDQIFWNPDLSAFAVQDSLNPWHTIYGSSVKHLRYDANSTACDFERLGNGVNGSITWIISIPAGKTFTLPIYIAGSAASFEEAKLAFLALRDAPETFIRQKQEKYHSLEQTARLVIPDKNMEQAFRWVKYNTEWLVQEVPGIGTGLTAGTPDYPWWFGADSEYALKGAVMTGQKEMVYSTIDLLYRISEQTNGNGRVVHEVSTNGAVFNPGNINETPQFASLIWHVYQWTGDRNFLEKYYPFIRKGLNWLMEEKDEDGNLLPDGFGMMEIHGLDSEMIDVAAYTCKAFSDAAEMAEVLGESADADEFRRKSEQLASQINDTFWVEDFDSYADFVGTAGQARRLIKDAIQRADSLGKPWAVKELENTLDLIAAMPVNRKQGFVLHHNWVVNTPMETGIATREKALVALETGSRFVNPFGVFVTGIDRDETAGQDEGSFQTNREIFTYIGAVMTLPTGVQAVAENNYGRPDQALDYLKRMTRSFSYALPGSMYEVSPDFGMMAQAWNIYSYAVPIIGQFFGLQPDAANRVLTFSPQMPSEWDVASLENVRIGNDNFTFNYRKVENGAEWEITSDAAWDLIIPENPTIAEIRFNDSPILPDEEGKVRLTSRKGITITIHILEE